MKKILFFILCLTLLFVVFTFAEGSQVVEPEKSFITVELICSTDLYLEVEYFMNTMDYNKNAAVAVNQDDFNLNYTESKTVNGDINLFNDQRVVELTTIYGFG